MANDPTILETSGLIKEFKGFRAVNDVSLKVQRGHIHALIGPNGAGKTTVFNLLTKFLIPTAGRILYNGHDITAEHRRRWRGAVSSARSRSRRRSPTSRCSRTSASALQRATGTSYHFWKSDRSLDELNGRAMELLETVGPRRVRRHGDGRAGLRPQAGARDRHHARDRARVDAARRADRRAWATRTSTGSRS